MKIKFNEIIECSSQQSILTGQAGFGIRTFTEGLSSDIVNKIKDKIKCTYDVYIADQVTEEEIQKDASVVKRYPRTLRYAAVDLGENTTKYVIACTTYVGIDYGYFCHLDSNSRVGSNYVADILVFDQKPTANLFYELLKQKTFLPKDNACTPNNPELQMLLTGEPSYLAPRTIEIDETAPAINEQTAYIAMALLQSKINKDLDKKEELQDIAFQAQEAKIPTILKDFAALPSDMVCDKYFHTNYLQGHGMPNGYRMMFINENNKEEVDVEDYIYLNLDDNKFMNIDTDNFYFEKIKEAAVANNHPLFFALVSYLFHLSVQATTDYKFLYNLFVATETKKMLALEELTEDFFTKAKNANLPADKLKKFIASVNTTLDETIQSQSNKDCDAAMKVIAYLFANWQEVIALSHESQEILTNLWFKGKELVNYTKDNQHYDIKVIQYINTKDVEKNDFYAALRLVDRQDIWLSIVNDQFGSQVKKEYTPIIDNILSSKVQDKEGLITQFFGLNQDKALLSSYITNHPDKMSALTRIIQEICQEDKTSAMLQFLKAGNYDKDTCMVMRPIIEDYFRHILSDKMKVVEKKECSQNDINKNIESLSQFAQNIDKVNHGNCDKLTELGLPHFIEEYADFSYLYPTASNMKSIEYFLTLEGLVAAESLHLLGFIYDLLNNSTDYMGKKEEWLIAKRLKRPVTVRIDIFKKWLEEKVRAKQALTAKELTQYLTDKYSKNKKDEQKQEAQLMLDTIWQIFKGDTKTCEECTPTILDAAKWTSKERKEYLAKCKNDKEKAFITKYYSFWTSLIRKLFKKK